MMKRNAAKIVLGIILLLAIASQIPSAHAAQCSPGGTAGKYGFTLTGNVVLPTGSVPIAAVGRVTLDAAGKASGTESRSVGGGYADEALTGTYTVNAHCTGTATIRFYESGQLVRTSVLALVFDDDQREIRMLQKSLQLPDGTFLPVVVTVEARRTVTED